MNFLEALAEAKENPGVRYIMKSCLVVMYCDSEWEIDDGVDVVIISDSNDWGRET